MKFYHLNKQKWNQIPEKMMIDLSLEHTFIKLYNDDLVYCGIGLY